MVGYETDFLDTISKIHECRHFYTAVRECTVEYFFTDIPQIATLQKTVLR